MHAMSTGRSIQVSVTHTVLGIAIGAAIESMLPKFTQGASLTSLAFETTVQAGLNGAALVAVAGFLSNDDPTNGLPFSMALFQAQPEFAQRIEQISAVVKEQVSQAARRTVPLVPAV